MKFEQYLARKKGSSENSEDTDKESEHLKERSKIIHQIRSQMADQIKEPNEVKESAEIPKNILEELKIIKGETTTEKLVKLVEVKNRSIGGWRSMLEDKERIIKTYQLHLEKSVSRLTREYDRLYVTNNKTQIAIQGYEVKLKEFKEKFLEFTTLAEALEFINKEFPDVE